MSAFEVKLFPNPPRLTWNRERIPVRVKEFQILEILLCEPGFALGASSLHEKLRRGDRADAGPATSRSHVAHLRKAVRIVASDAVLLITEKAHGGSVYRLAIGADAVDAFRWERRALAARARLRAEHTTEAEIELDKVLSEYGGDLFPDAGGNRGQVRDRLRNTRRAARIDLACFRRDAGRPWDALDDLMDLAREYPATLNVWEFLVTCEWRSGRDLDAAQSCRSGIEAFHQHGLDATPLSALLTTILDGTLPR